MPQRRQFHHKRRKSGGPRRDAPSCAATIRTPPKPPVQYGKSFVLLEDLEKNTFEYSSGDLGSLCHEHRPMPPGLPGERVAAKGKWKYTLRSSPATGA